MNNSETSSLPKPPARFLISAPTLKKLASQQMALDICRQVAHNDVDICDDQYGWFHFFADIPLDPNVPVDIPALAQVVRESLTDSVKISVQNWFNYHQGKVFFDRDNAELNEVFVKCIDKFELKPNGTVSYLQTAKNLLISNIITIVEKFRLACINCMADEIRRIWPSVRDDNRILNHPSWQKHAMIHYWVRTMHGDVRRFPGGDADSLESCAQIMKNIEWTAIEYFWNFLSQDEQVTFGWDLFSMQCKKKQATTPEQLLLRLNSDQLRLIAAKKGDVLDDVLMHFFYSPSSCGGFVHVWNYLAYFMRQSDFPYILAEFVRNAFRGSWPTNCRLINQIWINSPIHLKRKIFSSDIYLYDIFDALDIDDKSKLNLIDNWDYDMSFFVTLLTECSFQRRNEIWRKFWRYLIVGTAPSFLQRMMKLCFNNDDEIVEFKERYMMHFPNIHDYCRLLIRSHRVSELNEYLHFCSTNVHYIATVKRQILASTDVQKAFIDTAFSTFVEFDKFIDTAFFDEREARDYKRGLMLSSQRLQDAHAKVDRSQIGVSWV